MFPIGLFSNLTRLQYDSAPIIFQYLTKLSIWSLNGVDLQNGQRTFVLYLVESALQN